MRIEILGHYMNLALEEAKASLREGNSGFGAVIIKGNQLISRAHDLDRTLKDPTSHAELNAIRQASRILKGSLSGCTLICTHEPCPMCSTAMVWSGIEIIAYGCSIKESLRQGRKRISLGCRELFERAGAGVEVLDNIMQAECSLLYNSEVRKSLKQLRNTAPQNLKQLSENLAQKRIDWIKRHKPAFRGEDVLTGAYHLFINKLGIGADEAPVVERHKDRLVIHSKNFCPTLEACKILELDTRIVCKQLTEEPMRAMLRQFNSCLDFERNYKCLRPYTPYCEEMIILKKT